MIKKKKKRNAVKMLPSFYMAYSVMDISKQASNFQTLKSSILKKVIAI